MKEERLNHNLWLMYWNHSLAPYYAGYAFIFGEHQKNYNILLIAAGYGMIFFCAQNDISRTYRHSILDTFYFDNYSTNYITHFLYYISWAECCRFILEEYNVYVSSPPNTS